MMYYYIEHYTKTSICIKQENPQRQFVQKVQRYQSRKYFFTLDFWVKREHLIIL